THRHLTPPYDTLTSVQSCHAKDNTVLRAEPTSKSNILERLPSGTQVTTSNRAVNGWWEVTINGTTGWAAHRHLTRHYDTITSGQLGRASGSEGVPTHHTTTSLTIER